MTLRNYMTLSISPYSVRMRENTDQKNSEYRQFLRSVMYYLFSTKLSNSLSIKTANIHKTFNELKSVFILQYFYSGYLNSRKIFPNVLIYAQSTLSINLVIILVHVGKYLCACTKNWHMGKFVPIKVQRLLFADR